MAVFPLRPAVDPTIHPLPVGAGESTDQATRLLQGLGKLDGFGIQLSDDGGCAGDGATNDTVKFAAAVAVAAAAGIPVLGKPGKTYKIGAVALPDGADIRLNGAAILSTVSAGAGAFTASGVSDVKISNGYAEGTAGAFLLLADGVDGAEVTGMVCDTISAFSSLGDTDNTYANGSTSDNTGIKVNNNIGVAPATGNVAFAEFRYGSDGEAIGNTITGYGHGIFWWGGDADATADGAITNVRKWNGMVIEGNTVRGCAGGGIWGSMGQAIAVGPNVVSGCGDVGVDFEGCFDSTATGGVYTDNVNGNLTTFGLNMQVSFNGCTSIATDSAHPLAFVHNNSGSASGAGNRDVSFKGCVMFCADSEPGLVQSEAANRFIFSGNTLTNVKVKANENNIHCVEIDDNTLWFPTTAGAAFNAIDVGQNHQYAGVPPEISVCRNKIKSDGNQPAGSAGINCCQDDPNSSPQVTLQGNRVRGFPITIQSEWATANAGMHAVIRAIDNGCWVGTLDHTDSGAASAVLIEADNYDINGDPVTF